jgi:hypothetical protein
VMELKGKMILISRKREEFLFVYRETSPEDYLEIKSTMVRLQLTLAQEITAYL